MKNQRTKENNKKYVIKDKYLNYLFWIKVCDIKSCCRELVFF